MITKIETAKLLVTALLSLNNRWAKTAQLRDLAISEDLENRQKLMDPTLPPEDFTKFSNLARAAQRRRANLHDKLIEIEDSIRTKAAELQTIGAEMTVAPLVMPSPELAKVDDEYLEQPADAEVEVEAETEAFVDPEAPAEEAA